MARQLVEETIDGRKYRFGRITPMKSMKLLVKILKVVAPGLSGSTGGGLGGEAKVGDVDLGKVLEMDAGSVASKLLENLNEDVFESLCYQILQQTMYAAEQSGGLITKENFDIIFSGELPDGEDVGIMHILKVIAKALEVEYKSFLGGRLGLENFMGNPSAKPEPTTQAQAT